MIERDLKEIHEADLLRLISDPVREGRTIEYKSEVNLRTDDAKRKFLASIASFANAAGGDFVLGVRTDSADKALPVGLQPLAGFNADADVLMLQEIIRRHISPKIFALDFKPVQISGGNALVIRIRKTWTGAHMVTYNDDYRFYTRNQGGRYLMDAPEVRGVFLAGETAVRNLADFRSERVTRLASGERLIPTNGGSLLVIHLFAVESFSPGFRAELRNLTEGPENWMLLAPRAKQYGWRLRYSLAGPMAYITPGTDPDIAAMYTQVFRNGALEFVDSEYIARDGAVINGIGVEIAIMGATSKLLEATKRLAINPPYYVLPSILGIGGRKLDFFVDTHQKAARAIPHEHIILPETTIEDPATDLAGAFRPSFDILFNSCGLAGSPHFSANGAFVNDWRKHYV